MRLYTYTHTHTHTSEFIEKGKEIEKRKSKANEEEKVVIRKIGKEEKGAISTLVLFTVLMFVTILMSVFITIGVRQKSGLKSALRVAEVYGEDVEKVDEVYDELVNKNADNTELENLKALLAQTNATEDKILKDYKAYANGKLLTGTMENYAGKTVTASNITKNGDNVEITIPAAGYYGADSKVSIPASDMYKNLATNMDILNYANVEYYNASSYGTAQNEAIGVTSNNRVSNQTTYTDYADITLPQNWKVEEGDTLTLYGQYSANGGQGYRLGFVDIDGAYHEVCADFTNGGTTNSHKLFLSLESCKGITVSKIRITVFPINASVWVKFTQMRLYR